MSFTDGAFTHPKFPACNICKHFILGTISCKAFERIPDEILDCEDDHKLPVRGDNGIQWEPNE